MFLTESGLNFKNLSHGIWTPHPAIWSLAVRGSHRMTGQCQGISDLAGYPSADIWIILISTYPNSCVLLKIQFPISCRLRHKKIRTGSFFFSPNFYFFSQLPCCTSDHPQATFPVMPPPTPHPALFFALSRSLCVRGLQTFSRITACKPRITAVRICLALHVSADHKFTSVRTQTCWHATQTHTGKIFTLPRTHIKLGTKKKNNACFETGAAHSKYTQKL